MGFPGRPRVGLSRVSDPPGLGTFRRQGAHRAARGTIREKRYNLPHPGVHHTSLNSSQGWREFTEFFYVLIIEPGGGLRTTQRTFL